MVWKQRLRVIFTAKEVFGDTAVFVGSARLAYLIIAKNSGLSALSKIGIVRGGGSSGYTSYQVIKKSSTYLGDKTELVLNGNLKLNNVIVTTTLNNNIPDHPVLNLLFGMNSGVNLNNVQESFRTIHSAGQTILESRSNLTQNSGVINALYAQNAN